jgi:hypothetical protein
MRDGQAHTAQPYTHTATEPPRAPHAAAAGAHAPNTRTSGDSTVAMVGFWLMADTKRLYRMRAVSYSVLSSCGHGEGGSARVWPEISNHSAALHWEEEGSAPEQQLAPTQASTSTSTSTSTIAASQPATHQPVSSR